jgi:hypothetical protein
MADIWSSDTNKFLNLDDPERLGERVSVLYSEVADDVEKYRNLYRLNTMREND